MTRQQNYFVDQKFTLRTSCEFQKRIFLLEKDKSKHLPKKFEIYDIATTYPHNNSLIDASQEPVKGNSYELELVKVRDNSSETTKD